MSLQFEPDRRKFEDFLDLQLRLVGLRIDSVSVELSAVYSGLANSFGRVRSKYYRRDRDPVICLGHNAQCTILLYELSRRLFEQGDRSSADRIYTLIRMLSAVDLYYEVLLPKLWVCDHPLGSVIGRGKFDPDATLFFAQNCNIGNNFGVYPKISGNLHMFANSSLIGDTKILGNVVLANGAYVIDAGELKDCIVFGRGSEIQRHPLDSNKFAELNAFELRR